MTTKKTKLPDSIREFVESQSTMPVADLWKVDLEEHRSPYGSCWHRAVACILLSGRVRPKGDGDPNMTEANRVGKEANFNQDFIERVARFLIAAEIVEADRLGEYRAGPNLDAYWEHDAEGLKTATREAVLRLVQRRTGIQPWRPTMVHHSLLIEFLTLFYASFQGLAQDASQVGRVMHEFGQLPEKDLAKAAQGLGLKAGAVDARSWNYWLDAKGQAALLAALYDVEWAYGAKHQGAGWHFASPTGLGMLGLQPPPRPPELATVFRVLPDLSVFAGAGLAREKLIPLFRYAIIKQIDQVFAFRLDRKRLAEASSLDSPGEELRSALRELEPFPPTVADLLSTKSKLGGKIGIRWCSALVKPEDSETLAAIRAHPQLKGYLEAGAPPGYLLIKGRSSPDNFVRRCRDLGFVVEMM